MKIDCAIKRAMMSSIEFSIICNKNTIFILIRSLSNVTLVPFTQ
jgi:hypothetical protein